MPRRQQAITHGPWTGVRTVSEPGAETKDVLYDALNGYIPDPVHGSGVAVRPPVTVQDNPRTGRVGQAILDYQDSLGRAFRFVVRGGRLERLAGSMASSGFIDVTPTNIQIDPTARVHLTQFADQIAVSDGVNVPWLYDPGNLTATRIPYNTPAVVLSRGTPDTKVAVASTPVTLSGVTTVRSSAGVTLGAGTVGAMTWGAWRLAVDASGAFTAVPASASMTYGSEALAIQNLPAVPAGAWDLGYVTVKAGAGAWTAGTDALQGGASGAPANTTNYFAGAYTSWTATGAPVVYSGQLMWVLNAVNGTAARTTIAWSEISAPLVGYQQANYDNAWTLTQTSTDPIWALCATNAALYYFRRTSIGEITGAISRTWRTTATHDAVSTTIGCTNAAAIVLAHEAVWFVSDDGLPFRLVLGERRVDPLWRSLRDVTDAQAPESVITGGGAGTNTPYAMAAYQPELKLVLMALRKGAVDAVTTLYVFHGETGTYHGRWQIGAPLCAIDAMGTLREYTGVPYLCFLGASDATASASLAASRGAFLVQWRITDISAARPWSDNPTAGVALQASITTAQMLGDAGTTKRFDRCRVRMRASFGAIGGRPRQFSVTLDAPWASGLAGLSPFLSDGTAEDRTLIVGLGISGRWLRTTVSGPIVWSDLATETGFLLTTASGVRLVAAGADQPTYGQLMFEAVEMTAHILGKDAVLR